MMPILIHYTVAIRLVRRVFVVNSCKFQKFPQPGLELTTERNLKNVFQAAKQRPSPWRGDGGAEPLPETPESVFLEEYLDNHRINLNVRQVN